MRGCTRARSWLRRLVDGELGFEDELRLEQHLAVCAECRALRERAQQVEEALAQLPEPPAARLDVERSLGAIWQAIDASQRAPRRAAPARLLAAAAALIGLPLVLWRIPRATPAAELDGLTRVAPAAEPGSAELADPLVMTAPAAQTSELRVAPDSEPTDPGGLGLGTPAPSAPSEVDPERLAAARERVADALVECLGALGADAPRAAVDAGAAAFDTRASALARAGWPLAHIAEGLLGAGEPAVASAAARYLGVRADRRSLKSLERALARPGVKRDALAALGDAGLGGLDGLALALRDRELADPALARIAALGGRAAARVLEEHCRAAQSAAERARSLSALTHIGPDALESLLRLAEARALTPDELGRALERCDGAAEALGALCAEGARERDTEVVLVAVARLRPVRALPWLAQLGARRGWRASALAGLAGYPEQDALLIVVRLALEGRAARAEAQPAFERMLADDPARAASLARALARAELSPADPAHSASGLADGAQVALALELGELLASSGRAEAVPALLELAAAASLDEGERTWAVLAAAALAVAEHAPLFRAAFAGFGQRERRLAAAHLVALCIVAGEAAAVDALGPLPERSGARIRALLTRSRTSRDPSVALFQLAREIEPLLRTPDSDSPQSPPPTP